MTRKDIISKNIEQLNNVDEAVELIGLLDYDECLMILNRIQTLPERIFRATVDRMKALRGITPELTLAMMQNIANGKT